MIVSLTLIRAADRRSRDAGELPPVPAQASFGATAREAG